MDLEEMQDTGCKQDVEEEIMFFFLFNNTIIFSICTLFVWLKVVNEPELFVQHIVLLLHALLLLVVFILRS